MINHQLAGTKGSFDADRGSLVSGSVSIVATEPEVLNDLTSLHCAYYWPTQYEVKSMEGGLPRFPADPGVEAPGAGDLLCRPMASESFGATNLEMVEIYNAVKSKGVLNFRGAMIKLKRALNLQLWEDIAHMHGDHTLARMMRYGFPSGQQGHVIPAAGLNNHSSSLKNPVNVQACLKKEMSLGAMMGPFQKAPFDPWTRSNPMLTKPKRDSNELRVILDLSFLHDTSVNSGIL